MKIFDQEHYHLMAQFEREHSGRFDREAKDLWPNGIIYQDGRVNELFLAYRRGYAFCEADMRSDIQNLEASRDGYRADADAAHETLAAIGDYAHAHSTGPAVPDALWEVRRMAYNTMQSITSGGAA